MSKEIIIPHEIEILFKDAMENRTAEFDVLDKAFYDFCDSIGVSEMSFKEADKMRSDLLSLTDKHMEFAFYLGFRAAMNVK